MNLDVKSYWDGSLRGSLQAFHHSLLLFLYPPRMLCHALHIARLCHLLPIYPNVCPIYTSPIEPVFVSNCFLRFQALKLSLPFVTHVVFVQCFVLVV